MSYTVFVQPEARLGPIKPLHGVGGGPVTTHFQYDASDFFREAGIPFGRTHDIEYPFGAGEYVDIHCVFPNFDADVNDPRSYNFVFTDEYLKAMAAVGTRPFYRLGSTIEHQPIKRYIFPPKDSVKWGEICSHIIAHYNEGWANGFHMNIEYWEIWNEPDIPQCWQGTQEEFFALYDAASHVIKRDHPNVKVGGCALTTPFSEMAEPFLTYITTHGCPIDFFSWHGYFHTPEEVVRLSNKADELLQKYGLSHIESIFNEWNYVTNWQDEIQKAIDLHKSAFCASFAAAVIASLQHTRTDIGIYYEAQLPGQSVWNGLFSPQPMTAHGDRIGLTCEKPYYALKAWNALYTLGIEVECHAAAPLYAAAASDGSTIAILLSYYDDSKPYSGKRLPDADVTFDLAGASFARCEALMLDDEHALEPVAFDGKMLRMQCGTAVLVRFER